MRDAVAPWCLALLAIIAVLALAARRAPAHGLEFSVETTTDRRVRIGGFYEGGAALREAAVVVTDAAGRTLFEGRTDGDGFTFFTPPGPGVYGFTIDDGAGHKIRERFVLQSFQLDGTVRDLFGAAGLPQSWLEKLKNLPRWLTALFGLSLIVNFFVLLAWWRAAAEVRRLKSARAGAAPAGARPPAGPVT
ncbi:MAG: hypothetical protein JXQ29_09020 [Planctomycetes bacterium]|nr:hypothetical protein [Planctomycetota bacterium]